MKILIIDADLGAARALSRALQAQGFVVDVCDDALTGLHEASEGAHALWIVAVALRGSDGLQLLQRLRLDKQTPTLMIASGDALHERMDALHDGADDVINRRFAVAEAVARVRAILRRAPASTPCTLRIGDLVLDLSRRRAQRADTAIFLSGQEFSLLALLMRRATQVLTRATILSQVWDMNFDSDANVVDAAIRRLRNKIDTPFPVPLIHTVRGMGYVLEPR